MKSVISSWTLQHRWLVLGLCLVMLTSMTAGLKHLRFSVDYEYFFGADNPELMAYNRLKETYTDTDNLVFIVIPKDSTVFHRQPLALIEELTEKAWLLPFANRVDSISNYQHTEATGDDLQVEYLAENAEHLSEEQLERVQRVALTEPNLLDFLQAKNGETTAVIATFNLPNESPEEIVSLVSEAKVLIADLEARYPDIKIKPIGLTMLSYTYGQASRQDIATLTPAMFGLIILLVALLTRSVWSTLLSFSVITATILASLGIFSWLRIPLTTVTAVAPTIMMAIVVAHVVHIIEGFYQEWQVGTNKTAALRKTIEINLTPIFVTSVTTLIGFLSMNFNDVPPYRDLGNLIAISVVVAFILSLFFLPALLSLLPVRPRKSTITQNQFEKLGQWVLGKRTPILLSATAFIAICISLIPQNTMNEKYVEQFDESFEFRRDSDYFTDKISGIYSAEYSIVSPDKTENSITNPAMLRTVDAFTQWLRQQPETRHVLSITDTFKRLNMNMHGDDPSWYTLPDNQALASQYLLLYELSLPYGLDLNNQLNMEKTSTRVVVRFDDLDSSALMELEQRIEQWWLTHAPEYDVTGASTTLMFTHIVERAVNSMVFGTLAAFVLISGVMIMALRSWKLGLLSLIPNILPIVMGLGVWAMINGEIGMSFAVVVVLTLGIIVDDTVHFLSKFQHARKTLKLDDEAAIRYSFKTVGVAITTTTLALSSGFIVLSQSGFARNADMGLMAAITIFIALVVDLFVLPALLVNKNKPAPFTTQELSYE